MLPIIGGCLCGAIRYEIHAPVTGLRACHCTHCQKSSGAGGSVNAVLATSDFRITQGSTSVYADKADSGRTLMRHFCGNCGSPIYSFREVTPERIVVRAGTMENLPPVAITSHIWTRSKCAWSHIDPAAEQLPGNPA
jgi:hypothetical protein